MRESRYNKLHGHKLLVAQRREQLMQMIMNEPDRKWSVRDMADEARKLEWFQEHQPSYGKTTAHSDYIAVMDDLKDKREELASYYIEEHLNATDLMLNELEDDLQSIEKEESVINAMIEKMEDALEYADPNAKETENILTEVNKLIKSGRMIRKERRDIHTSMLSVMRRQSTLVPIQVPFEQKGVNVQVNNVQLTLDDFHKEKARIKQKQQQVHLSLPEPIDGDYEEVNDTD